MNATFDTNILIEFLNGVPEADTELRLYQERFISRVVWMEVLCGVIGLPEEAATRQFLAAFTIVEIDEALADEAVRLRRQHRLKLPDAIVLATARICGCDLVTRNTRDFSSSMQGIRVPY
jgi:predicted nucleic acid-binding protein